MPLGGFQFGCPTALFGLDAVVLAGAGSLQEVASGVEPTAKAGFDGKGFGVNQPGALQQPGFVAATGPPVSCGAFDAVGVFEALGLVPQPGRQLAPLPQQTFQSDLDHGLAVV